MSHVTTSKPAPRKGQARAQAAAGADAVQRLWTQGLQAREQGRWPDAEQAFAEAARRMPGDVLLWVNLADARRHQDDLDGAADAAARALACDARHTVARHIAADVTARRLMAAGPVAAQLAQLPEALRRDAVVLTAMARAMWTARRTVDAVSTLMAALAVDPARLESHELLMFCFRDLGMKAEAAECAKTVLALAPDALAVRMHLLFDQRGACDWSDLQANIDAVCDSIAAWPEEGSSPLPVFGLLSLDIDPALTLKAARLTARHLTRQARPLPMPTPAQRRAGRLRVGFLSHDFRNHPVTQLIVDTVEKLDRSRCEVFLYAHGPADDSEWRHRLQAGADHFVDFGEATDSAMAHRIRNDGVDLLVDLGGHTRGTRLSVLAWRPSPVQACFLGYPGTTGADGVDYLVGDAIVTPLAHAADASEKLAQLAGCVLPASRHRPLPAAMSRAEAGLPDDAIVLCAFNNGYKLLPATFDIWCEALRANDRAVLWLKAPNEALKVNLRREAAARGVAPERLIFAEDKIAFDDHFSRLALADLFVDNWPYNAHTTASDALWAGLPVLTMCGRSYAARVAGSLLHGAGLDAFVCDSPDAYRQRLLALLADPAELAAARAHLERERESLPIFDSQAYADDLLALFERMHGRWMQGQAADHLSAERPAEIVAVARPVTAASEAAPAVSPPAKTPTEGLIRLHIGGKQAKAGWKVLNIQPGPAVDYVGDLCDLSAFPDACAEAVYASHVLEHVSQQRMPGTLKGLARVLVPGGLLMVSVPDLEVLSHTIISPHATNQQKFHAMRMMFGGQVDPHDYHCFGWTFAFMRQFLTEAGFSTVERVESFGLFKDTSDFKPWGFPISLNVVATR